MEGNIKRIEKGGMSTTNTTKNRHGFTIVELIIVIVIIAVLAVISIVAYNGIQNRAKASEASSALAQAKKKLELYKVDYGNYPATGSLAAAGITNGRVVYQYTGSGQSYCISGTVDNIAYNASNTAAPTPGVCSGHTAPSGGSETTYAIGDTGPGGGVVFYDAGSQQAWGRYLEAAPANWSGGADPEVAWGCWGTSITGAYSETIGGGKDNTLAIVSACAEEGIAPRLADNYSGGGKNDWYLPNMDELNELFIQKAVIPGLATGSGYYWSSTERLSTLSWGQRISDNVQGSYSKLSAAGYRVRPIRAF